MSEHEHRRTEESQLRRTLLPDASMMLGCPRRSGSSRDEPGMLTGSERTGWILHEWGRVTQTHTHSFLRNPTQVRTSPEAVKVQVICVKVQERLLGIRRALGLKDRGRGRDDCGLARRLNGLKLKLGSHPQAAVGASMGDNLHLRV